MSGELWQEEVAALGLQTERCEAVHFVRRVLPRDHSRWAAAVRIETYDDDVPMPGSPLALDPEKLSTHIEDQVVALVCV